MSTQEFTSQISALRPTLRLFTQRFTRNREESQDLVQDTLMKALMYRTKFREDTNLKGWLFTIMRNTYINNYRRNQRARTIKDDTRDLHYLNVAEVHTFNKPESNLEFNEMWKHIESLREELRTPFKMYTTGYKYNEIADQLDLPLGTVKNRIFHARKEIQKLIMG
ncbi:MAG: RNA polymerase sigma factor [Cyclobacteriaceae bacterium]|nr:RNA polymerase sigma factor [Cyclobacteriaceae bacterium]